MENPFKYLNLAAITRDLVPIKSFKHKLRGANSNGNPITFTPQDRNRIADVLLTLAARIRAGVVLVAFTGLIACSKQIPSPRTPEVTEAAPARITDTIKIVNQ